MAKPQHAAPGGRRQRVRVPSDINHVRCRGAKSFVDDLGHSRGVVFSRAVHFCDLLRLSPLTGRFVRFRRTRLPFLSFFSPRPVTVRQNRLLVASTSFGQARVNGGCIFDRPASELRVCVVRSYGAGNRNARVKGNLVYGCGGYGAGTPERYTNG